MNSRIFSLLLLSSVFALSACSNGGGDGDKGGAPSSSQPSSVQSSSSSSSSASSVAVEKGGTFTLSLKEAKVTRDATGETLTVPVTGVQSGERTIE